MNVVLQAMTSTTADIRRFEKHTQMNIFKIKGKSVSGFFGATKLRLSGKENAIANVPAFPSENYKLTYEPWLLPSQDAIRAAYNTTAPCALYANPFYTISLKLKDKIAFPLNIIGSRIEEIKDNAIFSAIVDSVRRPKCITEAAEAYIDANIGTDEFVTVHWRYNKEDWLRTCHLEKKRNTCEILKNITAEDIANAIVNNLPLMKNSNRSKTIFVYIATPPTLNGFKLEILNHLENITRQIVRRVPTDLNSYLNESGVEKCWKDTHWVSSSEILSLAEMEIMRNSNYFFHSVGSTWSSNIRPLRWKWTDGKIERKFEASILGLAKTIMTKRINGI
ncbi:uncharacterized protein LOC143461183 isoform X2 [Clavelina lepadiformis]